MSIREEKENADIKFINANDVRKSLERHSSRSTLEEKLDAVTQKIMNGSLDERSSEKARDHQSSNSNVDPDGKKETLNELSYQKQRERFEELLRSQLMNNQQLKENEHYQQKKQRTSFSEEKDLLKLCNNFSLNHLNLNANEDTFHINSLTATTTPPLITNNDLIDNSSSSSIPSKISIDDHIQQQPQQQQQQHPVITYMNSTTFPPLPYPSQYQQLFIQQQQQQYLNNNNNNLMNYYPTNFPSIPTYHQSMNMNTYTSPSYNMSTASFHHQNQLTNRPPNHIENQMNLIGSSFPSSMLMNGSNNNPFPNSFTNSVDPSSHLSIAPNSPVGFANNPNGIPSFMLNQLTSTTSGVNSDFEYLTSVLPSLITSTTTSITASIITTTSSSSHISNDVARQFPFVTTQTDQPIVITTTTTTTSSGKGSTDHTISLYDEKTIINCRNEVKRTESLNTLYSSTGDMLKSEETTEMIDTKPLIVNETKTHRRHSDRAESNPLLENGTLSDDHLNENDDQLSQENDRENRPYRSSLSKSLQRSLSKEYIYFDDTESKISPSSTQLEKKKVKNLEKDQSPFQHVETNERPREGLRISIPNPHDPSVLIEGVLFRCKYLGSTQLMTSMKTAKRNSSSQATKAMRMAQAQEAVNMIKAPDGETQPNVDVDLFVSTEKIMVLNIDLQEIMMDHSLRSISYIADIGDLVVLMAKRKHNKSELQPTMVCHVFETDEAQIVAHSIGHAFQVAYIEFLRANGIDDASYSKDLDYQDVLNQQEMLSTSEELEMFSKKESQKEVIVKKLKNETLGIVIVESGWGSMVPTVVVANIAPSSPCARCSNLNIGDQLISINGMSLVGLPLNVCQMKLKECKMKSTIVRLVVVPCPPVVEILIKRPDTKYQLGFSVQNGIICSLLRGGIAERGGVRVGHRIIEINGTSVVTTSHEKIVNMLATSIGELRLKTMPTQMYRLLTGQEQPIYS
ncbi:hypothetical protein SNEBB_001713 [Seison nebaliae]|nr:hypothetical protein SNEBB_001713 [Seison nebaliae]